ncbi:MAG: S9 family peptidase [Chloroflexi bacterium]|nr:S9 family peptidase [Chloroflexota bacterium]
MQIAPYGSWKSPITSDLIVSESVRLGQLMLDGDDIYWVEIRPQEKGRYVIVRRTPDGVAADVNPTPFNARTRVHEYGGGAYLVADGVVYFSNFADQRLYRQQPGSPPEALTPEKEWRYADAILDRGRNRLICIREDHTDPSREAVNTVVAVSLETGESTVLASGNNFYSSPRLSPDGNRLAWLTWNHPNMPWDGTELWVGELDSRGAVTAPLQVAGGPAESIFQPEWSPSGVLHFVSDRTGWWNLYRLKNDQVEALCPMEAEFGGPQWVFGLSLYAFAGGAIVCAYEKNGNSHLASLDPGTLKLEPIELPYTEILRVKAGNGFVVLGVESPTEPGALVWLDLATNRIEVLRRSSNLTIDPGYLSIPQAIEFPTENGLTAHAIFYPPTNRDFNAPEGEKPPLLVMSHGGPTGATSTAFNLGVQYWTSRGIAVVDVNYGGSTGYGRQYRQRLNEQWGVVDMNDCANAALYLAEQGLADRNKLAITGGSAGGYTTLCALTFRDEFKAGASHYGVSDLEALATDTHKFESRYLDSMIGPYPARRDLYIERSPIHHTYKLSCALILFQGLEDKVVPPSQSQKMFEAARAKELPVAYVAFEGEQHGFRQAANIKRALDGELYFYSKVFGFELAEAVEPVEIENL